MIGDPTRRMTIGELVEHPQFGTGHVLSRVGRRKVRIAFDEQPSLPRTIAVAELMGGSPVAAPASASEAKPKPKAVALTVAPAGIAPLERSDAWQSLEALRLGVVPGTGTLHYTVGRDAELKQIQALLDSATGYLAVFGDYGTGKTHLLDATEQLAQSANFATVRLTIDPTEIAIQNPARVWGALARKLCFEGDVGLEQVLERFSLSPEHTAAGGERISPFLSPCAWALEAGSTPLRALALDHLHGDRVDIARYRRSLKIAGWDGPIPTDLPDYRTMGRVYVYLMSTLASWIRDLGGAGLMVILDEVERVDALTSMDRHFAMEFQKHLAAGTIPSSDLGFEPSELYAGGHARHRNLPDRFEEDSPLVVVSAMTPLESTLASFGEITTGKAYSLRLREPGDQEMRELVGRIAGLYGTAYPGFSVGAPLLGLVADVLLDAVAMGEASFRMAVRATVQTLDQARLDRG